MKLRVLVRLILVIAAVFIHAVAGAQSSAIQNAGHLSRYIAGINNQITATNRQAWEQQQASYDRISRRFSEYTRGVDTYHNPVTNQPIQLPGGYGRAWTNSLGEYIVSDSSSYNPNIGSSTNWQSLQRVP